MKVWIFLLAGSMALSTAHAQLTSTFDTGTEGWTAIDNQSGPTPTFVASGGNPGGFIQVRDGVGGTAAYFVAPAKFLGNRASSYGQTLRFDLQVSITANSSTAGVRLTGGGLVLVKLLTPDFQLPVVRPNWSSYSFRLDESVAWRVGSTGGPLATPAQIQTVLGALTELAINGEYSTTGADEGGLDNVVMEAGDPGLITVYNALSLNNDLQNDFFRIDNIQTVSPVNTVTVYNRWGDEVWMGTNYDNDRVVFVGKSQDGSVLPSGVYFYRINAEAGEPLTGYLHLRK
ncbi:MAG: gliding motility-associated C-terminal domain-containing protein [Cyclobacteriaceae bacterium]|nr:gliding motility-associated C-terminal domain-containing protein [Cyclobacteriaceae bacterium]